MTLERPAVASRSRAVLSCGCIDSVAWPEIARVTTSRPSGDRRGPSALRLAAWDS